MRGCKSYKINKHGEGNKQGGWIFFVNFNKHGGGKAYQINKEEGQKTANCFANVNKGKQLCGNSQEG